MGNVCSGIEVLHDQQDYMRATPMVNLLLHEAAVIHQ